MDGWVGEEAGGVGEDLTSERSNADEGGAGGSSPVGLDLIPKGSGLHPLGTLRRACRLLK